MGTPSGKSEPIHVQLFPWIRNLTVCGTATATQSQILTKNVLLGRPNRWSGFDSVH